MEERYRAKCNHCRKVGESQTPSINDAIFAIPHNPNCPYLKGVSMNPDVIDLRVADDF